MSNSEATSDLTSTDGATAFFTICARNYLACATLLGESVLEHHPRASFTIWLLDPGELPEIPQGIRVRPIAEAVPTSEFENLAFYYDILELATAVKPLCFKRHFAEQAGRVVYLDPDIEVFRPFCAVFELLDAGAQGVLTPHVLAPLPRDDAQPDDLVLLQAGIYNLGFLALAADARTRELLDWWWDWLRTHCFSEKATGTFTDQKWMNFAPLFWPRIEVLRDTTYNVAYWNLAQRRLERGDAGWLVDGRPLTFFHYSGFDPRRPELLSKHQTRLDVKQGSALARVLERYVEQVVARGYHQLRGLPLPPVIFDNDVPADSVARQAYRDALRQGLRFPRPLRTGVGSFYGWLCGPVFRDIQGRAAQPLTRYLMTLYELRADVRQVYPDLYGADREGFLHWAREKAVPEMGADPELLARQFRSAAATDAPACAAPPRPDLQVNLVGYLRAALGIGEAARGYARAMQSQEIPLRFIDATALTSSPATDDTLELGSTDAQDLPPGGVNLIHINADQLLNFRDQVGPEFFAGRYNIGIWAWETQEFPEEWHDRFELLDEVWAGSSFIVDAVARVSPLPVLRIPHVLEVPSLEPDRARFDLPEDETLLLFYFDFHSTTRRKNPQATLEAFRRAFDPAEPVRLVIKSINARSRPEDRARLEARAAGLRVSFIDDALSSDDRYRLLVSCDAFVSLHRAEGFGLGLAEAMAYGLPVIATGWSGNMDFMTPTNSFPVNYSLQRQEQDDPPYRAGTLWAEPDLDHAATLMRTVWQDRTLAEQVGQRARCDIASRLSPDTVGRMIRERLERIVAGTPRNRPSATAGLAPAPAGQPVSGLRAATAGVLRGGWRWTLRLTPVRHHPRLHRMTERLRRTVTTALSR